MAGTPSIAVVDVQKAIGMSDEAQLKLEKLKAELAHEEADLKSVRNEIESLQERYKKDAAVMSTDEKRKIEKEMDDKLAEFKFLGGKLQKRSQQEQQELFGQMLPKFKRALKNLQDEKKFDIILQKEAALWVDPEYDITKQVIEKMNALKD